MRAVNVCIDKEIHIETRMNLLFVKFHHLYEAYSDSKYCFAVKKLE